MKLSIKCQDSYSRGELLLRTIFGWLYIAIPHLFLMAFVGIWAGILNCIGLIIVLFTGKWPKNWFEFLIKFINWQMRVNATFSNLVDGYPAIGTNGTSDKVNLEVPYPDKINQLMVIVRWLFGWLYIGIPHMFCLMFRMLWGGILSFLAWWVILFTGKYPESWHAYQVGSFRWLLRVNLYYGCMTDEYPPFSGKE